MEKLKQRILQEGKNLGNGILKVDSLINHQVDPTLMQEAGRELAQRFRHTQATRILTAETSGILPSLATANALGIPMVFARKKQPATMTGPTFTAHAPSHTKDETVPLIVSQEFIKPDDNVLIIDDFLARGETITALVNIIQQASANLVGIGTLVEKTFEGGRKKLSNLNIPIISLVSITTMNDGTILFSDNE